MAFLSILCAIHLFYFPLPPSRENICISVPVLSPLPFNMFFSSSINFPAKFRISFFFSAEWYSIVFVYHILIIHLLVKGCLDCFQFVAVVTRAAMNTAERVSII